MRQNILYGSLRLYSSAVHGNQYWDISFKRFSLLKCWLRILILVDFVHRILGEKDLVNKSEKKITILPSVFCKDSFKMDEYLTIKEEGLRK